MRPVSTWQGPVVTKVDMLASPKVDRASPSGGPFGLVQPGGRCVPDYSMDSLIRLPEVRRRSGLSSATIYRKMARGEFPAKVPLGANVVAWYESDIGRWVANPLGWAKAD